MRLADEEPVAVVQGFSPDMGWRQLAEAAVALRAGAFWVATNTDVTVPSPRGPLPGTARWWPRSPRTGRRQPDEIVGKPAPAAAPGVRRARSGARRPLVVGDRLDTDIEGANNGGVRQPARPHGRHRARRPPGGPARRCVPTYVAL